MGQQSYRLATYAGTDGVPRAGLVIDQRIGDLDQALLGSGIRPDARQPLSVLRILHRWQELAPRLRSMAQRIRAGSTEWSAVPLASVRLLAPVMYPGTIFCAGANYKDHVVEMSKALNLPPEPDPHELGLKPWHFIKPSAACVRGSGEVIALPAYSRRVDWEAEIALVIGRECRDVGVSEALRYVAGITIVNDLSARDHLKRDQVAPDSPFRYDWVSQKCFDGALPMGPWITPLEDIGDVGNLSIRLWLNEEIMQDSSSANLVFSCAEQIAHLSTRLTLRPGDVIATGTPAGCGAARGRFLQRGDRIRIQVEGVGELHSEFA
ncbi:MAG TPA: fumarylacetoacetate hydrolase family protein [Steroidobacteraceae bacterium]|nr:fumarylacetoacetate hydrolase family protein [Steroidobacteraceae bacterium]